MSALRGLRWLTAPAEWLRFVDMQVSCVDALGWRSRSRKEVIQPHLPIRLPCYDFTPVMTTPWQASPLRLDYLLLEQPTPMV